MSTVVCHQALHDPSTFPVVESTTMRLKLVPPNRSFVESLFSEKPLEKKPSYVHPNSLLKLSPKSLELCTESLGSETGNDTCSESTMLSYPNNSNRSYTNTTQEKSVRKDLVPKTESKKVVSARGFPPPLTTISSLNLLQIQRHHENGRLIIQAVAAPPMKCCFRAERSHGRLRLTCWKSQDDDDHKLPEARNEKSVHGMRRYNNGEEDDEVERRKQKFQWPSRCKEDGQGDKGMRRNWEPFWLATS